MSALSAEQEWKITAYVLDGGATFEGLRFVESLSEGGKQAATRLIQGLCAEAAGRGGAASVQALERGQFLINMMASRTPPARAPGGRGGD